MDDVVVRVPRKLWDQIEYFRKLNSCKESFEQYVILRLKLGLNEEIHKTLRKEKESILCPDANPKTTRLVFDYSHKFEYFLCDSCREDHKYKNPNFKESIKWG